MINNIHSQDKSLITVNSNVLRRTTNMITGIRPTGDLTIANYLGAIKPLLEKASQGTAVFVADLHALTDNEPSIIARYRFEIVKDYLALGVDPSSFYIYLQSSIGSETTKCANYLARLITVAELLRIPTLKDKLRGNLAPETANAALLGYPVLMAADIFLQDCNTVPVGEDQVAHLEIARELARRFNKRYGNVIHEPRPLELKTLRLLSLKGDGKMSKSNPAGAIFLTDTTDVIRKKIKAAETASPGEMTIKVENLDLMAQLLTIHNRKAQEEFQNLLRLHQAGEKVMGTFKSKLAEITVAFVSSFQSRRQAMTDDYVKEVLATGTEIAKKKAKSVIVKMESAMGFI